MTGLSTWFENKINKQKAMFTDRLAQGHEEAWSMCRSTKTDLNGSKDENVEASNVEPPKSNGSNAKHNYQTEQLLQRQIEHLEEKSRRQERTYSLCEEPAADVDDAMIGAKHDGQRARPELEDECLTDDTPSETISKLNAMLKDYLDLQRRMTVGKNRQRELEWLLAGERLWADKRVATVNGKIAECLKVSERLKSKNGEMLQLAEELHGRLRETVVCDEGGWDAMNQKIGRLEKDVANAKLTSTTQKGYLYELKILVTVLAIFTVLKTLF